MKRKFIIFNCDSIIYFKTLTLMLIVLFHSLLRSKTVHVVFVNYYPMAQKYLCLKVDFQPYYCSDNK